MNEQVALDAQVIVAGGGPTGLMLAAELKLAGVDVLVLEKFVQRPPESKASGINARSVEVLAQRGIVDRFMAVGFPGPFAHFGGIPLDISGLPTKHPYVLGIQQSVLEPLLEERARELGVRIRRDAEVTGFTETADGIAVDIRTPEGSATLNALYLAGCDGGRSAVRRAAGIDFVGTDPTMSALHGDVELTDPPRERIFGDNGRHARGSIIVAEIEPGVHRLMVFDFDGVADRNAPTDPEALRAACAKIAGTDFGMRSARWVARFNDTARQAAQYRKGRVLLAGDAAHIHFPAGGQGVNLGIQDAFNLGWKLAAVVRGDASDTLLDTYHDERHPVAERVLVNTRAQTALTRPDVQTEALRDVMRPIVALPNVNALLGAMVTQIDLRYPTECPHALAGLRAPDADLRLNGAETSLFALLHAGRPLLLVLRGEAPPRATAWAGRLTIAAAEAPSAWVLPNGETITAPDMVLVRPDGYVAWAGDTNDAAGLESALTRWVGAAGG